MAAAAALLSLSLPKLNVTKASASTAGSTITCVPETLENKFGRKGIKFSEPREVELTVRNGSSVKLQIPNAHDTSYKPKVYWKDDGFEEVLYTLPPSSSSSSNSRGGIGLVINEILEPNPKGPAAMAKTTAAASASEWTVTYVDSDSIDALQGSELFFRIIRMGFEDIYLSSPGSFSEKYGKDYFICTGPASMLVPLVVNPGEEWIGAQVIEHDNL